MGAFRVTVREFELTASGGAQDTIRLWDAPVSEPIRNMTIWVLSGGLVTAALDLDWEVLYGGGWTGEPFKEGSTHVRGKSQGSGSIAGGAELCDVIWEDATLLPGNKNIPFGRSVQDSALKGFPIVVELTNQKASPVSGRVVFVSRTVGDHV